MYHWDFTPVLQNSGLLAQGLLNTLKLTATALALGVPLGLALALLRLSGRRSLSWPAGFLIEFFRTTPPLVQLFWFFFALPILLALGLASRFAAFGLLVIVAVFEVFVHPGPYAIHGMWAALLLMIMRFGPGSLSLDEGLGRRG